MKLQLSTFKLASLALTLLALDIVILTNAVKIHANGFVNSTDNLIIAGVSLLVGLFLVGRTYRIVKNKMTYSIERTVSYEEEEYDGEYEDFEEEA